MGEWLKPAVLKTVSGVTRSGVRIPLPPPVCQRSGSSQAPPALSKSCPRSGQQHESMSSPIAMRLPTDGRRPDIHMFQSLLG